MRVLIALDWSEQAFAAVREVVYLYDLQEVILVHGIDLGMFQYPVVAEMSNLQGYDDFRRAMESAGHQLLDHTTTLLPSEGLSIARVCEFAKPASLILDKARDTGTDLIVIGARGRGRVGELVLGSVSHRVALHAGCSTLIVKDHSGPVKRVVVAVEGHEDGARIKAWLLAHPFKNSADLTIVSVVRPIPSTDTFSLFPLQDLDRYRSTVCRRSGERFGSRSHGSSLYGRHTGHDGRSDGHSDRALPFGRPSHYRLPWAQGA